MSVVDIPHSLENQVFEELLSKLSEGLPEIKIEALNKLEAEGDDSVMEALVDATSDISPQVRFHARRALSAVRKRCGEDFMRAGIMIVDTNGILDTEALDMAMEHGNFVFRMSAAREAGKLKDDRAVAVLSRRLAMEDHPFVRSIGVKAMARAAGPDAVEAILPFLKDKDSRVRANAIEAIMLADRDSTDFIRNILKDSDARVRANVVVALHGRQEGLDQVMTDMARGDIPSQHTCMWVLERLRSKDYAEAIKTLASSRIPEIRSRAEILIKNLDISAKVKKEKEIVGASRQIDVTGSELEIVKERVEAKYTFLKIVATLVILVVVIGGGYGAHKKYSRDKVYERAVSSLESGDFEMARNLFEGIGDFRDSREMIKVTEARTALAKAATYFSSGFFKEALNAYREIATNAPRAEREKASGGIRKCYETLVGEERRKGSFDGVVKWVEEAVTVYPDEAFFVSARKEAYINEAQRLADQRMYNDGMRILDNLAAIDSKAEVAQIKAEFMIRYARDLEKSGKQQEAIDVYGKIYASGSAEADTAREAIVQNYCVLVAARVVSGDTKGAIDVAQSARERFPADDRLKASAAKAMTADARRLMGIGDLRGASARLDEAAGLDSEGSGAMTVRAELDKMTSGVKTRPGEMLDGLKSAFDYIASEFAKSRGDSTARNRLSTACSDLAEAQAKSAKFEEATATLKKGLEMLPGDDVLTRALSEVYLSLGDSRYAEDNFESAEKFYRLSLNTLDNPQAREALGRTAIKDLYIKYLSGDYEDAIKGFKEILALDSSNDKARKGLALCYKETGDKMLRMKKHDEAFGALSNAFSTYPSLKGLKELYISSGVSLAKNLISAKNFDGATQILEKLKDSDPENPDIGAAVTSVYIARAEEEKAKKLAILQQEQENQRQMEEQRRLKIEQEARQRAELARQMEYRQKVFFESIDPKGDDRGPGNYRYPDFEEFKEGILDIVKVEALADGDHTLFKVTFDREVPTSVRSSGTSSRDGRSTSSWRTGENGWAFQVIDIYLNIDRVPGSGETRSLPGRRVRFAPADAWEKVILICPMAPHELENFINVKSNNSDLLQMKDRIIVPKSYQVQGSTISARVPYIETGRPGPDWGYQFLSLCFSEDDNPTILLNLEVYSAEDDRHFGGGTDFLGDPNVIDMITPEGVDQFSVLSNFVSRPDSRQDVYALVPMVDWDRRRK